MDSLCAQLTRLYYSEHLLECTRWRITTLTRHKVYMSDLPLLTPIVVTRTVSVRLVLNVTSLFVTSCRLKCDFTQPSTALSVLVCKGDSSVGLATRYGLDGPRIDSRWGRDFPHLSRTVQGPTQLPVLLISGSFSGGKTEGMWSWPTSII